MVLMLSACIKEGFPWSYKLTFLNQNAMLVYLIILNISLPAGTAYGILNWATEGLGSEQTVLTVKSESVQEIPVPLP